MPKWNRTGGASALAPTREAPTAIGWRWEIKRAGYEARYVCVEIEVSAGFRVTDLPETARHAIRSRGATAIDAVLDQEDPPERIVVSARGIDTESTRPPAPKR